VGIDMDDALSDENLQRVLEQLAWHFTPDAATKRALIERTISLMADDPFKRANLSIDDALFLTMRQAYCTEFRSAS
jgi:hypothetical protein